MLKQNLILMVIGVKLCRKDSLYHADRHKPFDSIRIQKRADLRSRILTSTLRARRSFLARQSKQATKLQKKLQRKGLCACTKATFPTLTSQPDISSQEGQRRFLPRRGQNAASIEKKDMGKRDQRHGFGGGRREKKALVVTVAVRSVPRRAYGQTPHRAQVRHLGQRQCRVHGLLRQGAREQGRHRAAAAAAVQPQRPRGRPHDGRPSPVDCRRPPASREQQQRGVRPGRQGRRAEQVRAAAAVPPASGPPAAPTPRRAPPPPSPSPTRRRRRPPHAAGAEAAPRGAGATGAVRLAAEQRAAEPAEAVDRAQVRRVGRAERRVGGAGVHGAVREREAAPGGGQGRGAGRAARAVAADEGRRGQALSSGRPLLFKDVWMLPPDRQRLRTTYLNKRP